MSFSDRKRSLSGPATTPSPKKKKYLVKYKSTWEKDNDWLRKSSLGTDYGYCTVCCVNFTVGSSGRFDLKRHVQSVQHEKSIGAKQSSSNIAGFLRKPDSVHAQVLKSETIFSYTVAEHYKPFLFADHFTKLAPVLFPDSEIAKRFACSRTKCTQIVKHAIAPSLMKSVIDTCRDEHFSLMCDESNDRGSEKCFVILVRLFDTPKQSVRTFFLDMPVVNIGNAQNLFNALDECLRSRKIPWTNVVSFVSDNCSVMKGRKNSVISRIKEIQPHIFDVGCICHLANLCCQAGVKVLPFAVDDMLVDIFYFFHHSAKRQEIYSTFLEFCDVEPLKILRHASTRWLSLQKTVTRTLHHWPALTSYFNSQTEQQ